MEAIYTLKNNKRIMVFLWDDILDNSFYRTETDGHVISEKGTYVGDEFQIEILKDDKGEACFQYDGEKVYFKDFDYMTIDELINKINTREKNCHIREYEVLATFMKDTDNVGVKMGLSSLDTHILGMFGIAVYSPNEKGEPMLCVPTEKRYKKNNWYHKVTIEAEDLNIRPFYADETFYFSDLVSLINSDDIELVNKNKYKEQNNSQKKLKK